MAVRKLKESLPSRLNLNLEDFAQTYGGIDYKDIINLSSCWDNLNSEKKNRIKKLNSEIRKACKETMMDAYELAQEYPEDKANCDELVKLIKSCNSKQESKIISVNESLSNKVGYECNNYWFYKLNNKYYKVKVGTYPVELDDSIEIDSDDFEYAKRRGDKANFKINKSTFVSESKKLKESKFREFNKSDWMSYQGASNFEDGSSPLIAELLNGNITIIVSGGDNNDGKAFVEVDFFDELIDELYVYGNTFKSKGRAINAANQMAKELSGWNKDFIEDDIDDFAYSYNLEMIQ